MGRSTKPESALPFWQWNRKGHLRSVWAHRVLWSVSTLALVTLSCSGPGSPDSLVSLQHIRDEWRLAQEKLSAPEWVGDRAWEVGLQTVSFREKRGRFYCEGTYCNGCYYSSGTILYNGYVPEVIRHEAGHAILHRLGDRRWRCYEHQADCVINPR